MRDGFDAKGNQLAQEVMSGMTHRPTPATGRGHGQEWRLQHPKATLREIEAALDERLGKMRARMLEDAALASAAADLSQRPAAERLKCPQCGADLAARGYPTRELLEFRVRFERCPICRFPECLHRGYGGR